ncbi:hypothetical protein M426DRAFT_147711 [Hypoxylon sp. CI-4A]|nr:hypothetical protein M426DRAFT_147711 [Hypoxylon sp. CI-4A]
MIRKQDGRSRKRKVELISQDDRSSRYIADDNNLGLDWEWVRTLSQDPEDYDNFPAPFELPTSHTYTGDNNDMPMLPKSTDDVASAHYTAWVLARVRKMIVSRVVVAMINNADLHARWNIVLNKQYESRMPEFRALRLREKSTNTNHEAAFASIVGIVLPPSGACMGCKSHWGAFEHCIVLPDYLNGSCTNCHYNNRGSLCSHRSSANKSIMVASTCSASTPIDVSEPVERLTSGTTSKAIERVRAQLFDLQCEMESVLERRTCATMLKGIDRMRAQLFDPQCELDRLTKLVHG